MSNKDRMVEVLTKHLDPCRCSESWTNDEGSHYRAWMRCRCGWVSDDMPEGGNNPECRDVMARHCVAEIEQALGPWIVLSEPDSWPSLAKGGIVDCGHEVCGEA